MVSIGRCILCNANRRMSMSTYSPHLNYRWIRDNAESMHENMKRRHHKMDVSPFQVRDLYNTFVALDYQMSQLKKDRNQQAKLMKQLEANSPEWQNCIQKSKEYKEKIVLLEQELQQVRQRMYQEALYLPNETCSSVPIGKDEAAAETIEIVGDPIKKTFHKSHIDLLDDHDLAEFERAGKVTGTGFYYLKNAAALLELALVQYATERCIEHGFLPTTTPDLIRKEVLTGCGFAPRSDDPQTYFVSTHPDGSNSALCLTATAEFPLSAMYSQETLSSKSLPIKMVGLSHCFRAEGLAGSLNRGLYRVHQFTKVEMVVLSTPEQSSAMFQEMVALQRSMFQDLGLSFRILNMPSGDLGAPAFRKFDMEAWMPGREKWGEISSTSDCTDYQSRRLNIRYHSSSSASSTQFVHTLNGTAAAIPRLVLALLETWQQPNGDIVIPPVLRKYILGGRLERIQKGISLHDVLKT